MIKTSVNIMRGCFGGCSFCSITEHEGRIIQSRSEESILKEIEDIRDKVPGFTGVISDLGGPTANMYKLRCKSPKAEQTCRRASCVWPTICPHMDTDHSPTINLYRKARDLKGIKKILIASGVRYDIAVEDPRYIKELAKYHVGGYLKIAPEHTEEGPLSKMMKPGMGSYYQFKELFDKYSKEAGKQQYLIPYFISAHPGTTDEDMIESGALGQRESLQARSGAELLPVAARQRHHHVLHGEKPVKQGEPHRWRCVCCQGRAPSSPAQGAAALPRPRWLADDPRSPARHG